MGDRAHYKAKCLELERLVQLAMAAFSVIPTEELRRGHQWHPSEDALRAIELAKDAALRYSQDHWNGK